MAPYRGCGAGLSLKPMPPSQSPTVISWRQIDDSTVDHGPDGREGTGKTLNSSIWGLP